MGLIPEPTFERVEYDTVYLKGGWDLSTPTLEIYPGVLRDVENFEVSAVASGGYRRIDGYERYDGRAEPSKAAFTILEFSSLTNVPVVGNTITGDTSGATGILIALASNYMVLTAVVGTFVYEVLKVGALVITTSEPLVIVLTPKITAQYKNLAADYYRTLIGQVPGSGPVRGVVSYISGSTETVYAFRDNAGATLVELYKSSASGWTLVPFFREVSFTAGLGSGAGNATPPVEGDVITETLGGETANIKRVMTQTGTWAAGTAAGRFIIDTPTGSEFDGGAATSTGGEAFTLSGASTAITMAVGGQFEFDIGNFASQASTIRVYGCDGVNRGFEFDGTILAPITTATVTDNPTHVKIHKLQLFFAFGSSVIHSAPGQPYQWTNAAATSSEIGCGDVVTNFLNQPGTTTTAVLGITTRSNTLMLYGTGVSTWNLVGFNVGIGGIAFTGQLLNESYWFDSAGVTDLRTTQNFGNFKSATITSQISDYIELQRTKTVCSVVNRTKNQYRILFNDASALLMTVINGRFAGVTKALYADAMSCAWESYAVTKDERVFCGATSSGFVYRMDKGTSFDGSDIRAFLILNWNSIKSPRVKKRFRRASIEMQSFSYAEIQFGYNLQYGNPETRQAPSVSYDTGLIDIPFWDSFIWDAFVWDGVTLAPTNARVTGRAENIQYTITSGTDYIAGFNVNSIITHYSKGRGLR